MIPDATIVIVTHNRRDEELRAVASAPGRYLLPRLAKVIAHLLWLGIGVRRPGLFLRAILAGYRTAFPERRRREPVPPAFYRAFRRLGYAPAPIEAVEPVLPALREPSRPQEHVRA